MYFEKFKGQVFRSARELVRKRLPRKLAEVIRRQPGYKVGSNMMIGHSETGGWRLYTWTGWTWTTANLEDFDEPPICAAAVELGRRTSPKKAAAARANGKNGGGRPPKKGGQNDAI